MALESLAPDQRAVVQLVLQQGRSYADLAGLLGISEDAVRQRARAGIGVLGADDSVPEADQGLIADYLLGQQDERARTETRELMQTSPAALDWAQFVAEDLSPIARHGLPDLPSPRAAAAAPVREPEPEPEPVREPEPDREPELSEPEPDTAAEPDPDPEPVEDEPQPVTPRAARRERQRPRRERETTGEPKKRRERQRPSRERAAEGAAGATAATPDSDRKSGGRESSRLGGALLLAALALLVVVGAIYLANRGEDEPSATNTTSTEASATATPEPIAQLPLRAADGSEAEGLVQINASQQGQVGFTLVARNMKTTKSGESAYATWLVGKGKPALRLGFGEVLANQGGTLAVQGPEPKIPQETFTQGLTNYSQLIVSRESDGNVKEPTNAVLRGSLAALRRGGETGGGN